MEQILHYVETEKVNNGWVPCVSTTCENVNHKVMTKNDVEQFCKSLYSSSDIIDLIVSYEINFFDNKTINYSPVTNAVRLQAVYSTWVSSETLTKIIFSSSSTSSLREAVLHKNVNKKLRRKLLHSSNSLIRAHFSERNDLTEEEIVILLSDKNKMVRRFLSENLNVDSDVRIMSVFFKN